MKKINLIVAACLVATCASAQYGQKTNPNHPTSILTSAKVTSSQEFLVGGYYPTPPANGCHFTIDRLDGNGDIPTFAPYFSKDYKVTELPNSSCPSVNPVNNFIGMNVIETSFAGASYAMAGSYDNGVIFCLLDNNGDNIASLAVYNTRWPITMGGSPYGVRPYLVASNTPGVYYICGSSFQRTFVMKVDLSLPFPFNGWSCIYDEPGRGDNVRDIIESPYAPTGVPEVIVVGVCNDLISPAADQGFFMRLDAGTGKVIDQVLYGTPNGDEWLTSIEVATSGAAGGDGFIVGGRTSSTTIPWMMKVDHIGNPYWSTVIFPSNGESVMEISDVVERYDGQNPGNYQYYGSAGCTYNGLDNITVWKLDDNGNPVTPQCQFIYAMTGSNNLFLQSENSQIDLIGDGSVTPGDGLEVWSTDYTAGTGGYYFSKSYFNGVNGCNADVYMNKIAQGPGILNHSVPNNPPIQTGCTFMVNSISDGPFNGPCWNTTVAGGSNARAAQTTGIANVSAQQNANDVYPNPSNDKVTVSYNAEDNSQVKINVSNSLGQVVKTINTTKQSAGNYTEEIDFESMNAKAGIYFVNITIGNNTSSHKVMYMNNK